jgi:hypothetical protein
MLSSILSKLFKLCFVLGLLFGGCQLISQLTQKPLQISTGKNRYIILGEPGLSVKAHRNNSAEQWAPDTTVKYAFRDSNNHPVAGTIKISGIPLSDEKRKLGQLIADRRSKNLPIMLDTSIAIIGQQHPDKLLPDNTVSFTGTSDSAADLAAINKLYRDRLLSQYDPVNKISQEYVVKENLRIMPAGTVQHIAFVLYKLFTTGCLVLLCLCLAALFGNFKRKIYFTPGNVLLLKRAGWLVLLPSLAALVLYWTILYRIRPVKIMLGADTTPNPTVTYTIIPDADYTLLLLGAGLLVLGYIFNNAFTIKEDNDLIV